MTSVMIPHRGSFCSSFMSFKLVQVHNVCVLQIVVGHTERRLLKGLTLVNSAINSFQPCLMQWQTGTCRNTGSANFLQGTIIKHFACQLLSHSYAHARAQPLSCSHCYTPCSPEQSRHLHNMTLAINRSLLKMCRQSGSDPPSSSHWASRPKGLNRVCTCMYICDIHDFMS